MSTEIINLEKTIKSFYIIKYIFSFLSENKKLSLIFYNKQYQSKLEINIEYYKETSGKYKIAEKNGKGKEYDLNTYKLIFVGEYKNKKREGKGKEYYENGQLKFEGEYLNGRRWKGKGYNINGDFHLEIENGIVKEYFNKNKIKFEGGYLNGKIWNGKGYNLEGKEEFEIKNGKWYIKEFDYYGQLIYEGDYFNGDRNGKGKEYYNKNKLKFEGEYLNGKIWNGKGYNFEGNEEFEIKNGKGYIKVFNFFGNLTFEGDYIDGDRNGKGKEFNREYTLIYEGEYLNGQRNGKGKEYNKFGELIYEGEYLKGKRNGKGKEFDSEVILIFEGEYLKGERTGQGKNYDINGKLIYEGEYLNGERNGKGKEYDDNGKLIFEGEFVNGQAIKYYDYNDLMDDFLKLHKVSKIYDSNNNKINSLNNKSGYYKLCDSHDILIFEGEYINGKRNGKGKKYYENGKIKF